MEGDPAALAQLSAQVNEWQRPLTASTAAPFRLCFRLEEPDGNGDKSSIKRAAREAWYVRFLLQSAHDPGLLVSAGEAWRAKGRAKKGARHVSIIISSYALLYREFAILKGVPWAGVILDEAQNIKNPETKQARAARAFKAEYRIALTGTPFENSVGDLWSLMDYLNPGFLGTQAEFKRSWDWGQVYFVSILLLLFIFFPFCPTLSVSGAVLCVRLHAVVGL